MRRFAFICLLGTAKLFAADVATPASGAAVAQESRTIAIHAKDVIPVNAQIRETTLIVLPAQEKVMAVYCGDKDNWVIDGTENFVTVKPAKAGARTDVHILTDHGNAYTLSFSEVSNVPGAVSDVKLFLQPAEDGSRVRLQQQPVFVDANIAERYKQEAAAAEARAEAVQREAQRRPAPRLSNSAPVIPQSCNSIMRSMKRRRPRCRLMSPQSTGTTDSPIFAPIRRKCPRSMKSKMESRA